jgi:RNA polymerase sigma-70 factor, ECF subfamily
MEPSGNADLDKLRRAAAGDAEEFLALYRQHSPPIYRFARLMSGSEQVAQDVTQEVFVAVIEDLARFDPSRGSLRSYLYGLARNLVLRQRRAESRLVGLQDRASPCEPVASDNPLTELTRREAVEMTRRAVLSLPPRYREAVVLCDLEGLNYSEAADVAGCAVGTIRSRLHRARTLLARKLQDGRTRARRTSARCFA